MTSLILGTAQFGSSYGITNGVGRVSDDSLCEILGVADNADITLLDTAPDYGDAQSRLGMFRDHSRRRRFVSKFVLPPDDEKEIDEETLFSASLSALRVERLYGLLFHRVSDLRDSRAVSAWRVLARARDAGVISRIGASIYDDSDLEIILDRFPDIGIIQIPGNILDRRLLDHRGLRALHDRGVEVHVRSAYLQGLLLAGTKDLPPYFEQLKKILQQLEEVAESHNTTRMALALGYLKNHPVVDAVLVGATTSSELSSTIDAWNVATDAPIELLAQDLPVELIDPRQWPKAKVGT